MRTLLAAQVGARLHFAGEATSSDAPATTHGALGSGRRAAGEIGGSGASVVVVGSGFAGTGCARALVDRGHRVTVLEGRSRVGGRTWTERLAGVPAEMGASWIHGSVGNPMTDILDGTRGRRYPFDYYNVVGHDLAAYENFFGHQDELAKI